MNILLYIGKTVRRISLASFTLIIGLAVQSQAFASTVLFSDNFESGMGSWSNTSSGDNKNWTRDSGGTPSSSTGPSSGATGSLYYMYLETSSGSAYTNGDSAILIGPTISAGDIDISFDYHMYGSNIGALAVDILSGGSWVNDVWRISGQRHSSYSSSFTSVNIDLSSYSVSQIRFRATAAGGYRGDIAIDNVIVSSSPSGPAAPQFVSGSISKPDAREGQFYEGSIAADANDANGDEISFLMLDGPSWLNVSADGVLSGTPGAGDVGANAFSIEASDGVLTGSAIINVQVQDINAPIILSSDDFEGGLGQWHNVSVGDNKSWTHDSSGTPSSSTGPVSGANNSTFYAYLETSSGHAYSSGDSAILEGPVISGSNIELRFDYHLYGSNMGSLFVDVLSDGSWINGVWSIGGQQQSSGSSAYANESVYFEGFNVSQIRFRAVAVGGYRGDMAIDNIEIWSLNPGSLDTDSDGVIDSTDQCPNTPVGEVADANGCSSSQRDSDGDGFLDINDAFPNDASEWLDTDLDGIGNNTDLDDDNDGVADLSDHFPLDPNETTDTDNDGIGNNADLDDDGDGLDDINDAYPLISLGGLLDTDGNGIPNDCDTACMILGMVADTDDDGDGVVDVDDAFPLDASESLDTDGDLIGNNSDTDDDNDGVLDVNDSFPLISVSGFLDTDLDGIPNGCDNACAALGMFADADDDNDGVEDILDAFPLDATETIDSDGDGVGDNSDAFPINSNETMDSDGDGVGDNADAFPTDPTEAMDTDSDGVGNNADMDDDNDGIDDFLDAFPMDPTETLDTDVDGIGNNADTDDDNDGVEDTLDAFPLDASEILDSDDDGVGDNADAFPTDPTETLDTDEDGIGNNADTDDDNDGVEDTLDAFPLDPSRTHAYLVGGSLAGLDSVITLSLNGTESLSTDIDGSFQFSTIMQDGDEYSVSISAIPTDQVCTIDNASGTINPANIVDITVSCFQASYTLTPIVDGNIVDQPVDGIFDSISDTGLTISPKSFGGEDPYNQRAIMEFDLSQLPPGIQLESASLQMTAFSGTSGNTFLMHGYEGNGVIDLSDASASETLADIQIRSSKPSAVTFDITEYTNSLLSRGVTYLGLSLRGEERSNNAYLDFGASEYTQGAPTLTISLRGSGERSQAHHWQRIEVLTDGFATDNPIDGTFDTLNTNANSFDIQYSWVNYISRYIMKRSILEFNTVSMSGQGSAITYSRLHLYATQRGGSSITEIDLYGYDGDGAVTINDADATANYIDTVPLSSLGSFFYDITDHMQQLQLSATSYAGFQIRAASEGRSSSIDDDVGIVSSEGASPVFFAPYIEIRYEP